MSAIRSGVSVVGGSTAVETPDAHTPQLAPLFVPEPTAGFEEALQARLPGRLPRRVPIPIPRPIPWLFGSRFLIWKQDPSVPDPGIRKVYIPGLALNGPRDARLDTTLPGTTPVTRNANSDFIFQPGTPEFDCAHTFAVVRMTLTMYQRANGGSSIPWAWNTAGNTNGLEIFPRAGVTPNAFYSRGQQAVKFFFFTPSGASQPVFTCRSLDIVSHEAGHAILDGLKPGWLGMGNPPQTGGLHESFGDLTAIFLALSQLDQVEAFIAITKANLHAKNFLAVLAEQFGSALGRPMGLRNADNNLKLSEVSNEVHAISQVFTGGIYDVLADIFAFQKWQQRATKDPAQVLLEVSQQVRNLVFKAILQAPTVGATYADVVNQMLTISANQGDPAIYRTFIRNRFTFREVVVSSTPLRGLLKANLDDGDYIDGEDELEMEPVHFADDEAPQDRSTCCGTMQLPEYTLTDQRVITSGSGVTEDDLLAEDRKELVQAFASGATQAREPRQRPRARKG
jgi:hypothetical protein